MSPSPLDMPKRKPIAVELPKAAPAKFTGHVVRPATVTETSTHDGIVKAKHIKPGMVVRPFLHGKAVGKPRTVKSVEFLGENRDSVWVEFEADFEPQNYKPAYRWFVEALVGTPIRTRRAGFEVVR